MGLSIRAVGRAKRADCNGYVDDEAEELCDHDEALQFPLGPEGLKPGCYAPAKGGRSFSFELDYSSYAEWFDELCEMIYGVDAAGLSERYRRHRGKPFIELLDAPAGSQGDALGPRTCAKLHDDFAAFATRARKHFLQIEDGAWMWEVYRDFRKIFKIASDAGLVCFW